MLTIVFGQICWENRRNSTAYPVENEGKICRVSVDGTDFKIYEPAPFNPKWWSHKLNCAGLRYEVALTIESGDIVWATGPFPCGEYPDVRIFRRSLKSMLDEHEVVVADKGYTDEKCILTGLEIHDDNEISKIIRSRHETANRRLKQFFILSHRYRHSLDFHKFYFLAVAIVTQISFENGEPLFKL